MQIANDTFPTPLKLTLSFRIFWKNQPPPQKKTNKNKNKNKNKTHFLPLSSFLSAMLPNVTDLCYNSFSLQFSQIMNQILLKIVQYFAFMHAHKPKFKLFADSFQIFFLLLLLSFSLPFYSPYPCELLIKTFVRKWWSHKWFNVLAFKVGKKRLLQRKS